MARFPVLSRLKTDRWQSRSFHGRRAGVLYGLLAAAVAFGFSRYWAPTILPSPALIENEAPPSVAPPTLLDQRVIGNGAFRPGERLSYEVIWKGLAVGRASLAVEEGPRMLNRPTLRLMAAARSTPFFDGVFKVRDFNSSIVDRASLFSFAFHQNLREGRYRVVRNDRLDYRRRRFESTETKGGQTTRKTGELPTAYGDVLSSFYYVRTLPLKPGETYAVPIFRNGKTGEMPVRVRPFPAQIRVPAGVFDCIGVEPVIEGDSIFRSSGQVTLWLTNDDRKLPVLIDTKVSVGTVTVRLKSHIKEPAAR